MHISQCISPSAKNVFFHATQPSVSFKIGGGGKMQGEKWPKNFREMQENILLPLTGID